MALKYLFDNASEREARARMAALGAQHNDATFRYVEKSGIKLGWNCLEIGAGDGSVARWMAARVGPAGRVLATDIDLHHRLRERGLMQVQNYGAIAMFAGGSPGADLQQANFRHVHKAVIEAGLVSEDEFQEVMSLPTEVRNVKRRYPARKLQ